MTRRLRGAVTPFIDTFCVRCADNTGILWGSNATDWQKRIRFVAFVQSGYQWRLAEHHPVAAGRLPGWLVCINKLAGGYVDRQMVIGSNQLCPALRTRKSTGQCYRSPSQLGVPGTGFDAGTL